MKLAAFDCLTKVLAEKKYPLPKKANSLFNDLSIIDSENVNKENHERPVFGEKRKD